MNKKGFIDTEVLASPGFIILLLLAWSATTIGYIMSKKMESGGFPIWQVIIILVVEAIAAYFFAARG